MFKIIYGLLIVALVIFIVLILSAQPIYWDSEKIVMIGGILILGSVSGLGMIYFELES